jgi:hypothetical protein
MGGEENSSPARIANPPAMKATVAIAWMAWDPNQESMPKGPPGQVCLIGGEIGKPGMWMFFRRAAGGEGSNRREAATV